MKSLKYLLIILVSLTISISCNNDDDDNNVEECISCTISGYVINETGLDLDFIEAPVPCGTKEGRYELQEDFVSEPLNGETFTYEKGSLIQVECN